VLSVGTRTFCHLDDVAIVQDDAGIDSVPPSLLHCEREQPLVTDAGAASLDADEGVVEYGICFVDSALGKVTLAQFQDDFQRSRLRTMLSALPPSEVLFERIIVTEDDDGGGAFPGVSQETIGAVRLAAPRAVIEYLRSGEEFPCDPWATVRKIKAKKYFGGSESAEYASWPAVLQAVVGGLDDSSSALVVTALGGALWHLTRALIDHEVISMGRFMAYVPQDRCCVTLPVAISQGDSSFSSEMELSDSGAGSSSAADVLQGSAQVESADRPFMVLDAVALANLEVLQNNFDRSEKGSLWAFVNRCKTAFGRRLLRGWLVKPLLRPRDIRYRAAAVEELMSSLSSEAEASRKLLKSLPDLERLLSRVHTNGSKVRAVDHPDGRACMYEDKIYNGRKIRDFIDVLKGFEALLQLDKLFGEAAIESALLNRVLRPPQAARNGRFPVVDMRRLLKHFREIFDEAQAKRDGTIKPHRGLNPEYDQAMADAKDVERWFENYLREMKRDTGISDLNYWGTGKDRYQIEVPMSHASKVPNKWVTKSQKKTHRRYWTPSIEQKLQELVEAEER
jgi:DNA mismatch repair protein MSH6